MPIWWWIAVVCVVSFLGVCLVGTYHQKVTVMDFGEALKDRLMVCSILVFIGVCAVAVHGCWAAFDCDMRRWNAADYGRAYSTDRCVDDRARQGMWPAVWHGFAVPLPTVPLRHPSDRTD